MPYMRPYKKIVAHTHALHKALQEAVIHTHSLHEVLQDTAQLPSG